MILDELKKFLRYSILKAEGTFEARQIYLELLEKLSAMEAKFEAGKPIHIEAPNDLG